MHVANCLPADWSTDPGMQGLGSQASAPRQTAHIGLQINILAYRFLKNLKLPLTFLPSFLPPKSVILFFFFSSSVNLLTYAA